MKNQSLQAKMQNYVPCRLSWVLAHNACKCLECCQKRDHKNDNLRKKAARRTGLIGFDLQYKSRIFLVFLFCTMGVLL